MIQLHLSENKTILDAYCPTTPLFYVDYDGTFGQVTRVYVVKGDDKEGHDRLHSYFQLDGQWIADAHEGFASINGAFTVDMLKDPFKGSECESFDEYCAEIESYGVKIIR